MILKFFSTFFLFSMSAFSVKATSEFPHEWPIEPQIIQIPAAVIPVLDTEIDDDAKTEEYNDDNPYYSTEEEFDSDNT